MNGGSEVSPRGVSLVYLSYVFGPYLLFLFFFENSGDQVIATISFDNPHLRRGISCKVG
jgi:hypothetical protein